MGGLYLWLMGYRMLARFRPVTLWPLTGLGLAATGITGVGEAAYFYFARGVDVTRVLEANFSAVTGIRPAVFVFGITLAVTAAAFFRAAPRRVGQNPPRAAAAKRA
jgi:hypothetical protein